MKVRKARSKRTMPLLLATSLLIGLAAPAAGAGSAYAAINQTTATASVFTDYITADGDQLKDGGEPFRFASLNYPGGMADPAFSQEDAIRTIAEMGGKVTRTYVPSVKRYDNANAGSAFVLGPDANGVMQFNEEGFAKFDRLLALANQYGVRLIIPLVDQWQWVGGIESYVNFRYPGTITGDAATDEDGWKFYTDPQVISDFKQVIHYMMNRVNTITGVKYKDDKAILAWETGNELGGYNQDKFPQAWTTEIARYIKEEEQPKQLLLDGRFAINDASLTDPNIDIVGDHFYTGNFVDRINEDSARAAGKKPYILGEFGLYTSGAPVDALYNEALKNGTDGIMIWSLRPHKEAGGFYWHDENPGNWASYHWPGFSSGDYYGETDIIRTVYKYAHYMNTNDVNKTTAVPSIPAPANAPVLLPITSVADIKWQGSVGASGYEVQHSENGTDWTPVATNFSDGGRAGTPTFHDEQALTGHTYSYRVRGVNESGVSEWSNVVTTTAVHVITDEMSLLQNDSQKRITYVYDQSSNVLNSSSSGSEEGYDFKAYVSSANSGYLTYASPVPLNKASVAFTGTGSIRMYASAANGGFQEVQPTVNGSVLTADNLPAGTRYIKLVLAGGNSVQIDRVQLEYNYDGTGYQAIPPLVRNGFLIDNTFTGSAYSKSSNLTVNGAQDYTDHASTLGRTNGSEGEIVYQTDGDMTSYRFTTYSNVNTPMTFYASIDNETYVPVHPTVSTSATSGGWSKVIYTDFALPASTRYLKAVYPSSADGSSPAIGRVEIGFGSSLIPLTDKPPVNVFEDGEYDYGANDKIQTRYTRNTNGDNIAISLDADNKYRGSYGIKLDYSFASSYYAGLTRTLGHAILTGFDSLHAWVKPDGSSNSLSFQLKTANNRVYEAKSALTGTSARTIELKLSDFVQPQWNADAYGAGAIDLSDVTEFSVYISSGSGSTANAGIVYLDDIRMANASKLDNFEGYGGYNALLNKAFARNAGGGAFDVSLDSAHKSEGNYGLRVDYNFGGPGYAGGSFSPDFLNLKGYDGFTFWFQPDGSNNELAIQFTDATGKYWETKTVFKGSDARMMYVPFTAFRYPGWYSGDTTARPDANVNITAVSFYIGGSDDSTSTSGTFYIDDINGAKFADKLAGSSVTIEDPSNAITTLPYTISGTAVNADYVTVHAGKQTFHAPVGADGRWSYSTSKLANGTIDLTAAVELFDGTVMSSDTAALEVNVPNNPYEDGSGAPQTNYALNPGFEEAVDPTAWPTLPANWVHKDADGNDVTDGIVKLEGSARTGDYKLVHWNNAPYEVTSSQRITGLPNGVYEARAWTKSKGGQQAAEMIVNVPGQQQKSVNIPTGEGTWAYIRISDVEVRGGELTIGFRSKDLGDHWIGVDDVELVKTADLPTDPTDPTDPTTPTTPTTPTNPSTPGTTNPSETSSVNNGVVTIQPKADAKGKAAVSVDAKDMQSALEQNASGIVGIAIQVPKDASAVTVDVPIGKLTGNINQLGIDTGFVSLTLDRQWLDANGAGASGLQVAVALVDPSTLSADVREQLGGRPVYDLAISIDGKRIEDFGGAEILAAIPYALGESDNPNQVVIYYLDANGKLAMIKNGRYNAATGKVEFSAKHFSRYAAAYAEVQLSDLGTAAWAADSIKALAARGIVQGMGDGTFKPQGIVTRAQFVQMLLGALDLVDPNAEGSFNDVRSGVWYTQAIYSAQKLGIVSGRSDGSFGIQDAITREEMAVMIYRAAQVLKLELAGSAAEAAAFTDQQAISGYASEAVAVMQKAGLIKGMTGGAFVPQGKATRAQAAQLIDNLLTNA